MKAAEQAPESAEDKAKREERAKRFGGASESAENKEQRLERMKRFGAPISDAPHRQVKRLN
jgi:hypothetical protein